MTLLIIALLIIAAFAFGYHTGVDNERDRSTLQRLRERYDRYGQ